MNLADTSNSPTSSPDLMSNMTFLNLERVEIQKHASLWKRQEARKYLNNTVNRSDRRNVVNPRSLLCRHQKPKLDILHQNPEEATLRFHNFNKFYVHFTIYNIWDSSIQHLSPDECYFKIIKYVCFTDCDGGNPSISSMTPFSYSLCAVYLISPRYTPSFPF